MKPLKIAVLGVCNTRNVLSSACNNFINICFYGFQTCFLDITKEGLGIPYKLFYKEKSIEGQDDTAEFTKRTMQIDLNKTALKTIESLNPDYLLIDLSSVAMRLYKITYNGKTVFSHNAYSPSCYEKLGIGLKVEKIDLDEQQCKNYLKDFVQYLKDNWDLNKILLFNFKAPEYYIDMVDGKLKKYWASHWGIEQAKRISDVTNFFINELGYKNLKVFEDSDLKICKGMKETPPVPSTFHVTDLTQKLQGALFKEFLLHMNGGSSKLKKQLQEEINSKLT